jgi:hypothetical protein
MALDDQVAQARKDVARANVDLYRSLSRLRERLEDARDWRFWMRRKPAPFLACAAGLGFLIGRALTSPKHK